jgi:hypothetical protein
VLNKDPFVLHNFGDLIDTSVEVPGFKRKSSYGDPRKIPQRCIMYNYEEEKLVWKFVFT